MRFLKLSFLLIESPKKTREKVTYTATPSECKYLLTYVSQTLSLVLTAIKSKISKKWIKHSLTIYDKLKHNLEIALIRLSYQAIENKVLGKQSQGRS